MTDMNLVQLERSAQHLTRRFKRLENLMDEAGMMDVERFGKLLGAVQQLGVKLIVVGDGAQLQPVEAGPAFRLVTERLGKIELNTVIRQKEDWQREATLLFGQQKTAEAIQTYGDKGFVHIVEEKFPSLEEALANNDNAALTQLYHISKRVSSLMYREMIKDCHREHGKSGEVSYDLIKQHPDFEKYQEWKGLEEKAKTFVSDIPEAQKADVRQKTKETLIKEWHSSYLQSPEKSSLILAYSNRDINDLNRLTRSILKESGHLSNNDFIYTVKKVVEDDFGKKHILQEDQPFSKGDRIVFTCNNYGLGVKNGTMGTIIDLNNQKVQVKLDEGNTISFASKLNPHFNQGWAITIHKSQGTTVDQTYVLASYEMTQNLTYVAMTRHREDVKVYGSSLDFWRPDKLPEVLSKSGEKLGPADYLDGDSLKKLIEREDKILTKIFERVSNELEAMGAVAKKAFWQVANHFLDRTREKEALIIQSSVREEVRAEQILQEKQQAHTPTEQSISPNQEKISPALEAIYEEMKHPAYTNATIMKRAFEKGLKAYGEEQTIAYWERWRLNSIHLS